MSGAGLGTFGPPGPPPWKGHVASCAVIVPVRRRPRAQTVCFSRSTAAGAGAGAGAGGGKKTGAVRRFGSLSRSCRLGVVVRRSDLVNFAIP